MIIGEIKLPEMQSKDPIQEVELIVEGKVQGVGYRQCVAEIGSELKLFGSVKNLEDRTVKICCKGNRKAIDEFKKKITEKNQEDAPLLNVKKITENPLDIGTIQETSFKVLYGEPNAEIFEGNVTGMKYLNLFRKDTNANFAHMDEKYDAISIGMFSLVKEIKETNKTFENKIEKTEKSIESLEKDIKSLLNFLVDKKS